MHLAREVGDTSTIGIVVQYGRQFDSKISVGQRHKTIFRSPMGILGKVYGEYSVEVYFLMLNCFNHPSSNSKFTILPPHTIITSPLLRSRSFSLLQKGVRLVRHIDSLRLPFINSRESSTARGLNENSMVLCELITSLHGLKIRHHA
jgi:hypothetical protein